LKKPGDIGEKGLGSLAPIGIAKRCSFVTHPKQRGVSEPFFKIEMDKDKHIKGKREVEGYLDIIRDIKSLRLEF